MSKKEAEDREGGGLKESRGRRKNRWIKRGNEQDYV